MNGLNFRKIAWGGASVLALVLFAVWAQKEKETGVSPGAAQSDAVAAASKIDTVASAMRVGGQTWPGIVHARAMEEVAPPVAAWIVAINVNVGDRIRQGDVIARLRDRDIQARQQKAAVAYSFAAMQANRAELEARRLSASSAQEAGPSEGLDAARARAAATQTIADGAKSSFNDAYKNVAELTLRAPVAGVVVAKRKEAGELVSPADPIVTLQPDSDIALEVNLPDRCAASLEVGMQVQTRVDPMDQIVSGRIDEIAPKADEKTGHRQLKIKLPDSDKLKHGGFGWLHLACPQQ